MPTNENINGINDSIIPVTGIITSSLVFFLITAIINKVVQTINPIRPIINNKIRKVVVIAIAAIFSYNYSIYIISSVVNLENILFLWYKYVIRFFEVFYE